MLALLAFPAVFTYSHSEALKIGVKRSWAIDEQGTELNKVQKKSRRHGTLEGEIWTARNLGAAGLVGRERTDRHGFLARICFRQNARHSQTMKTYQGWFW